jgi:hypothetical protein
MSTDIGDEDLQIALPEPADRFHIDSDEKANWLVKKIVGTYVIEERAQQWSEKEKRRACREREFFLHRFGAELEAWLQQKLQEENGRRKSVAPPAGLVGYRTEPSRLQVIDEAKLLDWCRRVLPDAVKVSETVLRSAVADHVRTTGECPDGAELAGGGQRFYVK